jgi:hypothetical protein
MAMKKKAAKKPAKKKVIKKKPTKPSARRSTARKAVARRSSARKAAARPSKARSKSAPARASNTPRTPWFDAATHKPLINEYAERLQTFAQTMADGQVDRNELKAQENRLIASMQEVEPMLNGSVHEKVTRVMCELAAYDMMQSLRMMQESRQPTVFQG